MNPRIAIVGIGRMGANMARRLKDCGHSVTAVFDSRPGAAAELAAELQCAAPDTLAGVTAAADVILAAAARNDSTEYVFIAGNHDFFFEEAPLSEINALIPNNVIYLNDSGVHIEGIKIWGSPVQPRFYDWAFNRDRGEHIKKHWDLIPKGTDILITHGPAYGILDLTMDMRQVGCEELRKKVEEIKPKYHVFGHIHESHGIKTEEGTVFINASIDRKSVV
jgi:Icc-related predicted phosphoesterase